MSIVESQTTRVIQNTSRTPEITIRKGLNDSLTIGKTTKIMEILKQIFSLNNTYEISKFK